MSVLRSLVDWQWENATAGAVAGLATAAFTHPLDVVRTRFQGMLFDLTSLSMSYNDIWAYIDAMLTFKFLSEIYF